jgi:hypothetical protein
MQEYTIKEEKETYNMNTQAGDRCSQVRRPDFPPAGKVPGGRMGGGMEEVDIYYRDSRW